MEDTYKPSIYLDSDELPAIKNWKVGETYTLTVKVKQTGMRQKENGGIEGTFEIQSVKAKEKDLSEISEIDDNAEFAKQSSYYKQKTVK